MCGVTVVVLCNSFLWLSTTTEILRMSPSGWTTEGEGAEDSPAGGRDLSYAKPPQARTPNGPTISSRSTRSKVAPRKRGRDAARRTGKWTEETLERRTFIVLCVVTTPVSSTSVDTCRLRCFESRSASHFVFYSTDIRTRRMSISVSLNVDCFLCLFFCCIC